MRNHPVHWCDGLFLVPQHFQAADRYWSEMLQRSEHMDHEFNYGLRRFEYSADAIANSHFQVDVCLARTRDGTILALEQGEEPDRVPMKSAMSDSHELHEKLSTNLQLPLEAQPQLQIYLGIPKLKWGNVNVTSDGETGLFRFRELSITQQDESFGGNDQEITLKALRPKLVLSGEELTNYEYLPVARVKRAGDGGPELDRSYVPPLLAIDAWPPLHKGIIQSIYDQIGKKIEVYSENVISRKINWSSQEPSEAERLVLLSVLNEAYLGLAPMVFTAGIHPFTAYCELCRIMGRLSIFRASRRYPDDLPRYDHDNLGPVFQWFKTNILDLLDIGGSEQYYEMRWLEGFGRVGMGAAIESRWLDPDWVWYVGVHHEEVSQQVCQQLLAPNKLFWKLGSQSQVRMLFEQAVPGLTLKPAPQTPTALPVRNDWSYFEVTRQPGAVWSDVVATKSLGAWFRDRLVENRTSLKGKRTMIMNNNGKLIRLEFALFAVPMKQ